MKIEGEEGWMLSFLDRRLCIDLIDRGLGGVFCTIEEARCFKTFLYQEIDRMEAAIDALEAMPRPTDAAVSRLRDCIDLAFDLVDWAKRLQKK